MATPARAEAAAILPVFLMNSRREVWLFGFSFIGHIFLTLMDWCQFKKIPPFRWPHKGANNCHQQHTPTPRPSGARGGRDPPVQIIPVARCGCGHSNAGDTAPAPAGLFAGAIVGCGV